MLLPNKERDLTNRNGFWQHERNQQQSECEKYNCIDDPQKNTEMWGGVKLGYAPAMWAQFTHK